MIDQDKFIEEEIPEFCPKCGLCINDGECHEYGCGSN